MVALADLVGWNFFAQSDLHLKTLSSVYGLRWIFLSNVLWMVYASPDVCLKRWCAHCRHASYWLNCLSLHDYDVQLYHEDLGDETLSFLFKFLASWLDRSGGATIIDEDHGPWVVLPPLASCSFLESTNLNRNILSWFSREDYSFWLAIKWLHARFYWRKNFLWGFQTYWRINFLPMTASFLLQLFLATVLATWSLLFAWLFFLFT